MTAMRAPRPFTGWHMLAIIVAFFSVVIGVNVTMAVLANRTWSGLVVPNSYVASQNFNEEAAEAHRQKALGWKETLSHDAGLLTVTLSDKDGQPLNGMKVRVRIGHPVAEQFDHDLTLAQTGPGQYSIKSPLGIGTWDADVTAERDGRTFRLIHRFSVSQ